ncbi:methyl-accepting chemotaxis protein [Thalassospira xiamenensis]|uniref:Methyl-accepting chemotaxis sensory transducer with Cache sensor n=1 Tax=Thalassospira xiamenensis TaxID=220697 RepID=A0A285T4Y1_9PROT|nr:cache domain-containing protein [Thalassospira xiamenensis]SOC16296.1 methyl-accepting chemotaxis sensory transducer with Cache sensor [Thalassospira xiamenensis]
MKLSNFSLSAKLRMVLVMTAFALGGLAIFDLVTLRSALVEEKKANVRQIVDMTRSTFSHYDQLVKSGEITLEEAQTRATEFIQNARYAGNNYVFVLGLDTKVILHPIQPKLNGQNGKQVIDVNGVPILDEMVKAARNPEGGFLTYEWNKPGHDGVFPKLAYAETFKPWGWVVTTGVYIDDVDGIFWQTAINDIAVAIVMLIIIGMTGLAIDRSTTRPLRMITEALNKLAQGDTSVTTDETDRRDEIGALARSLDVFRSNREQAEKLEREQKDTHKTQIARAEKVEKLIKSFETEVEGNLSTVHSALEQLRATATGMASQSDATTGRAANVAAATEQAAANVDTVAAAAEQLAASIDEITSQVSRSSDIAQSGATEADEASTIFAELGTASDKIGEVVELIQSIAEQTNLLALNATIEAARAGDAGKGFAVVAAEVKNLANQTTRATEDIAGQIGGIQESTQNALGAIKHLSGRMKELNEVAASISAAVREQDAATAEIARNVAEAATGTKDVAQNVIGLREAAEEEREASGQVLAASGSLNNKSQNLMTQIKQFLNDIRAA